MLSIRMQRGNGGFSVVELIFVVLLIAMLTGMVISPALSRAQARLEVQNARDAYIMLAARARAAAMNSGEVVRLEIVPATNHAWVAKASGDTIESIRYADGGDFRVRVETSSGDTVRVCYTSRGFAMPIPGCTTNPLPSTITFSRGSYEARAEVRGLGQVVRQ